MKRLSTKLLCFGMCIAVLLFCLFVAWVVWQMIRIPNKPVEGAVTRELFKGLRVAIVSEELTEEAFKNTVTDYLSQNFIKGVRGETNRIIDGWGTPVLYRTDREIRICGPRDANVPELSGTNIAWKLGKGKSTLISAGKDGLYDTADDLTLEWDQKPVGCQKSSVGFEQ